MFCYRRKLDISLLLGALGLASFSYNVRYVGARHEEIFYLLPGRFWELLIGCGLAHMEINDPHPIDRLLRRLSLNPPDFARFRLSPDVKAVAALVFLAAAALRIHATPEFKFPGLWALLPTTSAFLLISAGPASRINRRLLSDKTAVLIGLISYPLYLWHYPIISFARLTNIFELSPGIRLGIAAASFLLAWLTWRFAERPLQARLFAELPPRRRDERSVLSGLFALAAIGALGLLSAGGAFDSKSQVRSQAFNEWHARSEKQYIEEARYGRCTDATKEFAHFSPECYSPSSGISVWLWGDSHAAALYSSLRAYLDPAVSLLQTNNSGCAPVLSPYTPNLSQKCRDGNDFVFRRIESVKPDVMILAASWHVYAARDKNFFDTLDATIREIKKRGARRVVVIGPAPRWTADLYKIAERKYLFYGKPFPRRGTLGLDKDTVALDARMGNHFAGTNTAYIPLASRLCNDEGCMTMVGENLPDDLIAFDDSHLNRKGATYVVENFIGPALSKTLKTPAPPRN